MGALPRGRRPRAARAAPARIGDGMSQHGEGERKDRLRRALEVFHDYLAQPSREPREAFLRRHAQLRDLLEPMLGGDETEQMVLDPETARPSDGPMPDRIGRFRILRELGRGGMGVVYLAYDERLDRNVALKAMAFGAERFEREVRALARVSHPSIIPVYDGGTDRGVAYFTMEFVPGATLGHILRGFVAAPLRPAELGPDDLHAFLATDAPLPGDTPIEVFVRWTAQIADALEHTHAHGIIHRDVKPSNIMIRASDARAMLFDFGLARPDDLEELTREGQFSGTSFYASPDQVRARTLDHRTDVYSLGVTLYEALALRVPFRGSGPDQVFGRILAGVPVPPSRFNPHVPRDLDAICQMAMDPVRGRRYPTAAAFADDLRRFLEGRAILARPVPTLRRLVRRAAHNRAAAVAAGLGAVLVLALALLPFALGRHARARAGALLEQARATREPLRAIRMALAADRAHASPESRGLLLELLELPLPPRRLEGHVGHARTVELSPDDRFALTVDEAGVLRSFELASDGPPLALRSPRLRAARFAGDSRRIVAVTHSGDPLVVRREGDRLVPETALRSAGAGPVLLGPRGEWILDASRDRLDLRGLADARPRWERTLPGGPPRSLVALAGGDVVLVVAERAELRSTADGAILGLVPGAEAYHPIADGERLLVESAGALRVIDPRTAHEVARLPVDPTAEQSYAWAGPFLAVPAGDTLPVLDTRDGTTIGRFEVSRHGRGRCRSRPTDVTCWPGTTPISCCCGSARASRWPASARCAPARPGGTRAHAASA